MACSFENFLGQLKHSPSRRHWPISSGESRLKWPSVGNGGLGAATGSADVEPVVGVAGVDRDEEADAR